MEIRHDGEKIKYFYNLGGQLSSIVGEKEYLYRYIDSTGYDAYEQKVYQRMGNGTKTTYDYSKERRRLKNLTVTSPKVTGGAIMDNTYGYDVMDNIISLVNNATPQIMQNGKTIGGSITHNYEYDNWSRLVHADGKFVAGSKSATYNLTMGYDKLYNITNKKLDVTQNNLQFDGTLKAGHDFTYKYDPKDPFRLLSVDAKEYRSSTEEVDTTRREHSYAFDGNGNLVLQLSDLAERIDSASFADTAAMQVRQYLWDEDNHLLAINDNGFVSNYFYDAAGERTVKISAPDLAVFVNGVEALKNDSALVKFVGYVSPYLVVSNGGRYTKHIYAGTQRIASKVGDIEVFGADPRRVEYAGANLKEVDFGAKYKKQTSALLARYDSLGVMNKPRELNDYVGGQSFCCGEKDLATDTASNENIFENAQFENIFFYFPNHLGSTTLITDGDGKISQYVTYIPYGEIFVEERNGSWNSPYLFNGKELDEETGLYYYGARYQNPSCGTWLSVDPLWEKNIDASPYSYCHGNPVKMVDPDGKDEYVFNEEGVFVKRVPKKGEHTGLWMGSEDREAIKFKFADPINDPKAIKQGDINRIEIVSDEMIDNPLWNSGVYNEENKDKRYSFAKTESSVSTSVCGKMDYKYTANFEKNSKQKTLSPDDINNINKGDNILYLTKTGTDYVGHNKSNFGNFLWGAGMSALGFWEITAKIGAHVNNYFNDVQSKFQLDSSDDQFSISLGFEWQRYREK